MTAPSRPVADIDHEAFPAVWIVLVLLLTAFATSVGTLVALRWLVQ